VPSTDGTVAHRLYSHSALGIAEEEEAAASTSVLCSSLVAASDDVAISGKILLKSRNARANAGHAQES